jgi:cell division protein FtsI/penicillin-binding protein 2
LDAGIQHIVESEIEAAYVRARPISVTCVVVRPRTGEILAMANVPTFDPNRLGEALRPLAEPGDHGCGGAGVDLQGAGGGGGVE